MLNQVNIMGRLCARPELRYTQSGLPVVNFRLAVDRSYLTNGQRETDFLSIVAWRGTAEFLSKYFEKGQLVALTGRIEVHPWTDRDGNRRENVEIVAENAYFCGGKASADAPAAQQGARNGDAYDNLPDMVA